MKKNSVNILTALAICAGLSCTAITADAQTTPRSNSSSSSMSDGPMTDQTFAQKAMEANLAEIMMAKLALQKGASERVKEYAQMMIDEHSSANDQLKSIVSGVAMGNAPEKMGTMGNDAQSGTTGSTGNTGSTTGNTTTGSSGAATTGEGATDTDAGVPGTAPTRSGTTGINNPSSTTSGTTDNNNVDNRTEKTGSDSGLGTTASPVAGSRMGRTDNMGDHSPGMNSAYFEDSTMLSPEHRAAKEKLQNLTGAAFDREYIQGQIKDHDRTAMLFEYEIKNGQDARLKEYARTLLPAILKHRQMATEIANSMMGRGANN